MKLGKVLLTMFAAFFLGVLVVGGTAPSIADTVVHRGFGGDGGDGGGGGGCFFGTIS